MMTREGIWVSFIFTDIFGGFGGVVVISLNILGVEDNFVFERCCYFERYFRIR